MITNSWITSSFSKESVFDSNEDVCKHNARFWGLGSLYNVFEVSHTSQYGCGVIEYAENKDKWLIYCLDQL